ncbi:sodium-dependent multivitamin transporter-like [Argopecten irradians]|uniref:sodium-dependent multivitamin transporter-like n=1 Tax=Argopecten irradians TaxID=31199 RepID=UPI003712C06C
MTYLKWEDYVLIAISVALSLGTGLFQTLRGKKDKTVSKYIMGNGKMAVLPVALSLLVSYQSGILMLGIPAEVYMYGMQFEIVLLGYLIGDLISLYLFIPSLSRLQMKSVYEYLEGRYTSRVIRLFATVLSIIMMINYMGTALAMPAVALKAVAGIDIWISIVGLMIVVLIYTMIGGFTAVVWTDVLQSILMFAGIFAIIFKGTIDSGGLQKTWQTAYDQGRVNLFIFDLDPTLRQSFWSLVIGGTCSSLFMPFLQTSYLRIKATPNIQSRTRMYILSAFLSMTMRFLAGICGAIMFAYFFNKGCDPLVSKQLDNANQLIPKMVLDTFQHTPCLPGLFMAALFCASLSTISSLLSGITSLLWEDIVKPYSKPVSERRGILMNQIICFTFGVIGIGNAFIVSQLEGPVIQIFTTTNASINGAIAGIFIMGFTVPWANKSGAIVGGATSVLLVAWITIGKMTSSGTRQNPTLGPAPIYNCPLYNVSSDTSYANSITTTVGNVTSRPDTTIRGPYGLDVLYSLSFHYLQPIGIIIVLVVGSIVSRLTKKTSESQTVDPDLVVPVCDLLCCCIPNAIKERLNIGVNYHNPNIAHTNTEDSKEQETCLNDGTPDI